MVEDRQQYFLRVYFPENKGDYRISSHEGSSAGLFLSFFLIIEEENSAERGGGAVARTFMTLSSSLTCLVVTCLFLPFPSFFGLILPLPPPTGPIFSKASFIVFGVGKKLKNILRGLRGGINAFARVWCTSQFTGEPFLSDRFPASPAPPSHSLQFLIDAVRPPPFLPLHSSPFLPPNPILILTRPRFPQKIPRDSSLEHDPLSSFDTGKMWTRLIGSGGSGVCGFPKQRKVLPPQYRMQPKSQVGIALDYRKLFFLQFFEYNCSVHSDPIRPVRLVFS